jgi:cyanophycinase
MAADFGLGATVAAEPSALDVNSSGAVEYLDALMIANQLQRATRYDDGLDVNRDGALNGRDFESVVSFLNEQNGISSSMEGEREFTESASKAGKGGGKVPYTYWRTGNANKDVRPSSGLGLMGGGTDVDELFKWLGAKANGGDILVIRATGTEAYNSYIQSLGLIPAANSVATLLIPDLAAANHPEVRNIIDQAEAIFIAGGDQADYVKSWNDTPVEDAIYAALGRDVPIAGTSAGLAVLGDVDFTALTGKTITSNEALLNPYDTRITLDTPTRDGFLTDREASSILSLLEDTITDSHFRGRDRMGRMLAFMARMDVDNLVDAPVVRGLGVNEQTALLVDANGDAKVVGNLLSATSLESRSVYVLEKANSSTNSVLSTPLRYENVKVFRAYSDGERGASFRLSDLQTVGSSADSFTESYFVSATGRVVGKKVAELISPDSPDGIYGDGGSVL